MRDVHINAIEVRKIKHFVLSIDAVNQIREGGIFIMAVDSIQKLVDQARAKAWVDKGFRKALIADPKKAIEGLFGITLPEKLNFNILEEKSDSITIVLPAQLNDAELSDDQLDAVAGGWGCFCDCVTADCFGLSCK